MKSRYIDAVIAANAEGRSVALATALKSGAQLLIDGDQSEGDLQLDEASIGAARQTLRADRNITLDTADGRVFVQVFSPSRRCFVVGAVHIAQPLVPMLIATDYKPIVIDPRGPGRPRRASPGSSCRPSGPTRLSSATSPIERRRS